MKNQKILSNIKKFGYNTAAGFLKSPFHIDLLIKYFQENTLKKKTEYGFYEYLLSVSGLSDLQIRCLKEISYSLFLSDNFIFREETIETIEIKNEDLKIILGSCLFLHDDIWFTFLTRSFHYYLVATYVMDFPLEEKIRLYNNLDNLLYEKGVEFEFCKYLYDLDNKAFIKYFMVYFLKKEVAFFEGKNPLELTIEFLKKSAFDFEFEYNKKEKIYEFHSGGGGDALIEDIFYHFELGPSIMWEIERCFNLSDCKDPQTKKYIKQYCDFKKGKYKIDSKEKIGTSRFHDILQSSGVINAVVNYRDNINNFLEKHNAI